MDITLEEFFPNTDLTKPNLLGSVRVNLGDKMFVWLVVFQGKGGPYLKFPGHKVGKQFVAAVGWFNTRMEETIREAIMPKLKPKLIQGPTQW
jgi:hypothetical protein